MAKFQIDWGNPLTNGLIACYVPGITRGQNIAATSGDLGPITVANNFDATVEGPSFKTATAADGLKATAPSAFLGNTNSFYWRGFIDNTSNLNNATDLIGIAYSDPETSPYIFQVIAVLNAVSGAIGLGWNAGGTLVNTTTKDLTTVPALYSYGGTFRPGGNAVFYKSGAVFSTDVYGANPTSTASSAIVLQGITEATPSAHSCKASCNIALIWNRELSAAEMAALDADPYCFLIPTERELPALLAPAAGTPFAQTNWPKVRSVVAVPQFVVPYNGNLFGGVPPPMPFAKYDWSVPRTEFSLPFPPRGAYNTSLYSAVVSKPFVPYAWTGGIFQQSSPPWRIPPNLNLYAIGPVSVPFVPYVWPTGIFQQSSPPWRIPPNLNLYAIGPVAIPFSQTNWPSVSDIKVGVARSDPSIMEFVVPFSKTDWPKPYVRQFITTALSAGGLVDLSVPFVPAMFPPAMAIKAVLAAPQPLNVNLYGAVVVSAPFRQTSWAVPFGVSGAAARLRIFANTLPLYAGLSGTLVATEPPDIAVINGVVVGAPISGYLATIEAPDVASIMGTTPAPETAQPGELNFGRRVVISRW